MPKARNIPNATYNNSWHNDSQNEHKQFGFNTYYKHDLNEMFTLILGGELRHWIADHFAETKDFDKSISAASKLMPWLLWTVIAQAKRKGICLMPAITRPSSSIFQLLPLFSHY